MRETLVPVEIKRMIDDTIMLQEDISEVYVAECSNESKPSNLQEMWDLKPKIVKIYQPGF